jgi:hypothetical protein
MNRIANEICRCDNEKSDAKNNDGIASAETIEKVVILHSRKAEFMESLDEWREHCLGSTIERSNDEKSD